MTPCNSQTCSVAKELNHRQTVFYIPSTHLYDFFLMWVFTVKILSILTNEWMHVTLCFTCLLWERIKFDGLDEVMPCTVHTALWLTVYESCSCRCSYRAVMAVYRQYLETHLTISSLGMSHIWELKEVITVPALTCGKLCYMKKYMVMLAVRLGSVFSWAPEY